jgi:hypothetical protein
MAENTENTGSGINLVGQSNIDSDMFQRRLEEIQAMPEGEAKQQAIKELTQDYQGLRELLGADVSAAEQLFNTKMPEGRNAGGIYVAANPLEFVSSALRQGLGAKGRANSMKQLRDLSDSQSSANAALWGAGMGGGGGQTPAVPQNMPSQAQKPDLGQYGAPTVNAGMGQITERVQQMPQPQQNAVNRRAGVRAAGGTPPPMGQGRVGQAKAAALRGMAGASKPDLGQYAPAANAGMPQLTDRNPRLPDMPSHQQQPLFGQNRAAELKNALASMDPTPEGVQWQSPEELRRKKEILSRQRMLGGY